MSATFLRLQQELIDYFKVEIEKLKSKQEGVTEEFIGVLEEEIMRSYSEGRDNHSDLISRNQAKHSTAIQKYLDDNMFGALRSAYLELIT